MVDTLLTEEQEQNILGNMILTNDIHSAIWLLGESYLVDGEYDCGMRGADHRCIEGLVDGIDRYNQDFFQIIHLEYNAIRLVPESMIALINSKQNISNKQKEQVESAGYTLEKY